MPIEAVKSPGIFKVSNDKLLSLGINNFYIFDIKTLELETTIKISLNKDILKMLVRPKGNILLLCRETIPEIRNMKESQKNHHTFALPSQILRQ